MRSVSLFICNVVLLLMFTTPAHSGKYDHPSLCQDYSEIAATTVAVRDGGVSKDFVLGNILTNLKADYARNGETMPADFEFMVRHVHDFVWADAQKGLSATGVATRYKVECVRITRLRQAEANAVRM